MTWSRPLQKHETTTFAFSATSIRYRPRASLERFRMWWWRLGLITATRMLQGTLQYNIAKLQHIQNSLAGVVLCATWNTHSKPLLTTGNALALGATSHDINKISLLIFKNLQNKKPVSALSVENRIEKTFFVDYIGYRTDFNTTAASRASRHSAPEIWNRLTLNTRRASSLGIFKKLVNQTIYNHFLMFWTFCFINYELALNFSNLANSLHDELTSFGQKLNIIW